LMRVAVAGRRRRLVFFGQLRHGGRDHGQRGHGYVAASVVGDLDFYTLGNLAAAPLSIFAVQAKICARKDDAATRAVRTRIRSNRDIANGATVGLAASYTYLSDIFETDPDTALAWTAAAVNALEVGQEVMT
jgi:hypothetical protein